MNKKVSGESVVKDIRRRTPKKYSSEEKIRIVLVSILSFCSIYISMQLKFLFKLNDY